MYHYLIFLLTIFFSILVSQVGLGNERAVYSPIDAGTLQQSRQPYLAEQITPISSSVKQDLFGTLPDDPVGPPDSDLKRQLKEIRETSRRESTASGNASTETPDPTPQPSEQQNPTPSPQPGTSHESGTVIAKEYVKGENGIIAILQDGSPIAVTQTTDGYYDEQNRKVVLVEGGQTVLPTKETTPLNNILLIILAFGSTFAAIFIGFIAWDNQRRLEEAIVSQNQRFTGGGTDTFSTDINSMEPETFSFSTDSLSGNSFESFDSGTSFRTIA